MKNHCSNILVVELILLTCSYSHKGFWVLHTSSLLSTHSQSHCLSSGCEWDTAIFWYKGLSNMWFPTAFFWMVSVTSTPSGAISCLELSMEGWGLISPSPIHDGVLIVPISSHFGLVAPAAVSSWVQQTCHGQRVPLHSTPPHASAHAVFPPLFLQCSLAGSDTDVSLRTEHPVIN